MTDRRGFLGAIVAAPWVVRSGVLMPVRRPIVSASERGVLVSSVLFAGTMHLCNGDTLRVGHGVITRDISITMTAAATGLDVFRYPDGTLRGVPKVAGR